MQNVIEIKLKYLVFPKTYKNRSVDGEFVFKPPCPLAAGSFAPDTIQ